MGAGRGRRRRTAIITAGVAIAVVAALVPLVSYLAPRILPNLFTSVSEVAETQRLSDGGVTATVTVPAGWAAQRAWGSDSELVLRSPDGRFSVALTLSPESAADAVAADPAVSALPAVVERLSSGLDAVHAQSDAALVVAVGSGSTTTSVVLEAAGTPDDLAPYRPAIADLLESVRAPS